MKFWIIFIFGILAVLLSFIYLYIPGKIVVTSETNVNAPRTALERTMYQDENWEHWWPAGNYSRNDSSPNSHSATDLYQYQIKEKAHSSIAVDIMKENHIAESTLHFFYRSNNDAILSWQAILPASGNPIKRFRYYRESRNLKNKMDSILQNIQSFFEDTKNIYGSLIEEKLVEDSILIFTSSVTTDYPSTSFVYSLIGKLKKYNEGNGIRETGYPMLNITTENPNRYLVRVAIPVDKALPETKDISFKRMMKMGNILVSEISGGPRTIEYAFRQMETYAHDHERTAPAIPYLSLVTDRMNESDTNKWVTRIYYPVR